MATCFVVMGFNTKTDYRTGRELNLDATYKYVIKPTVEECGLECIRADEIQHSGVIDLPMYQRLLDADLVIADISTANPNALYELGVRHALRPRATIIIAEDKFNYPFDLSHIVIRSYAHMGTDIGFGEVKRFTQVLTEAIQDWKRKSEAGAAGSLDPDSPVYTFLKELSPPYLKAAIETAIADHHDPSEAVSAVLRQASVPDESLAMIIAEGERAIADSRFQDAKRLFKQALNRSSTASMPGMISCAGDPYLVHRLTLATQKAKQPDEITAYHDALKLLDQLNLDETNDPETLGQAASIEKRLFQKGQGIDHLSRAIGYLERGYFLKNDYYNGINLAYLLDVRAGTDASPSAAEKIADHIGASRVRRNVLTICDQAIKCLQAKQEALAGLQDDDPQKTDVKNQIYWVLATQAEACFGLSELQQFQVARRADTEQFEDFDWRQRYASTMEAASRLAPAKWMLETTKSQILNLAGLLTAHFDLFRKLA